LIAGIFLRAYFGHLIFESNNDGKFDSVEIPTFFENDIYCQQSLRHYAEI